MQVRVPLDEAPREGGDPKRPSDPALHSDRSQMAAVVALCREAQLRSAALQRAGQLPTDRALHLPHWGLPRPRRPGLQPQPQTPR
jgi:hypothetical protein